MILSKYCRIGKVQGVYCLVGFKTIDYKIEYARNKVVKQVLKPHSKGVIWQLFENKI